MSDEIVVMVVDRGRRYLALQYEDPIDGKVHEKSAKTDKLKAAQRAAWEWQAELMPAEEGQSVLFGGFCSAQSSR